MEQGKWSRRLWAVNGVVLLVFLSVLLVMLAVERFGRGDSYREVPVEVSAAPSGQPVGARAVRLDSPLSIYGTSTRLVPIRYGTSTVDAEFYGVSGYGSGPRQVAPIVNILLLPASGSPRLLFSQPAYVKEINRASGPGDSLQQWIAFEAAFDDSNGDGKLDQADERTLWIADREGLNLRRVLPAGWTVSWYRPFRGGLQLLVSGLAPPSGGAAMALERRPQRVFLFDIGSGSVQPYEDLNRLIDSASTLLAR
jgi:hypothetical protein